MAIHIRSAAQVAAKYKARAAAAGPEYVEGVTNPSRDQAEASAAAAPTWAQGVQQAIADNRYADGVREAGSGRWKARSAGVGAQRYPQGVAAGAADYQAGIAPVLAALSTLELPPRMPRGDPQNIARVAAVAARMRQLRLEE